VQSQPKRLWWLVGVACKRGIDQCQKRTCLQSLAVSDVSRMGIEDWREGKGWGRVCHRATDSKAKTGPASS